MNCKLTQTKKQEREYRENIKDMRIRYMNMRCEELKRLCETRGLRKVGNKLDLVDRLCQPVYITMEYLQKKPTPVTSVQLTHLRSIVQRDPIYTTVLSEYQRLEHEHPIYSNICLKNGRVFGIYNPRTGLIHKTLYAEELEWCKSMNIPFTIPETLYNRPTAIEHGTCECGETIITYLEDVEYDIYDMFAPKPMEFLMSTTHCRYCMMGA